MAGFSVPKMPSKTDLGSTLETAVANKIGKTSSVTPGGWTKGKKTGWKGAAMPPGLAKKPTTPVPGKPNMNDQVLAMKPTKVRKKPLEGA